MLSISIFYSISIYKALYKRFGGFAADVVAAIDQVPVFSLEMKFMRKCQQYLIILFEVNC